MNHSINAKTDVMDMLLETSRTFFIPISQLPPVLREAVTSAYLCMRAIDEIEDHPNLPTNTKVDLLKSIGEILLLHNREEKLTALFQPFQSTLPEVTLRLAEWAEHSPSPITPLIMESTANMALGMAHWVSKEWRMRNEEDLDQYTYFVAGLVGVLLSDLWFWFEGIETDKGQAVAFGRGLQAVNMIRNRREDLDRGVDYFPDRWGMEEMIAYARRNLDIAISYSESIKPGPIHNFCKIPLALAYGTLRSIEAGEDKLSRNAVKEIVGQILGEF
jgi:farnesyl-diphosphate farnesyltransferase